MTVFVADSQVIGETESTLWSTIQQGPVSMMVSMKNSGTNTANYRFQEWNGIAWVDLGAFGTPLYNTLSVNQVVNLIVSSSYPKVQMVGNASGGADLEFAVTRYTNRGSGGAIPILSL